MSMDGLFTAKESAIKPPPMKPIIGTQPTTPPAEPLSIDTLERLETMPKNELRALLERVCGARWGEVAVMTKEQRIDAAKLKLWHEGLTSKEMTKYLPALREAMDRDTGKPAQSIAMTVENKGLDQLATDKLLRLASMLDEPVIIAPMPKKLDNDKSIG